MILAIRPDWVRPERGHIDRQSAFPTVPGIKTYRRFDERTERGAIGDSRAGTAEKGERFFEACVDNLEQICIHIMEGSLYDINE